MQSFIRRRQLSSSHAVANPVRVGFVADRSVLVTQQAQMLLEYARAACLLSGII